MTARIGIDTGGTFTDIVRWSSRGVQVHKLPSTPDDPARAVLAGLAAIRARPDEPVDVVHGTTVGLNAVLTGQLARVVFVTNRGFEDLIEIGRQERTELYALAPTRPAPPVPRELRVGVPCRRGPGGGIDVALTERAMLATVAAVRRLRPQAIAIGLLHSPSDPRDEQRLARALRAALPSIPVTCSAELSPTFGEYERFTAAILNAAIAPRVSAYTKRLSDGIGNGRLRLLRSSLGIMPATEAAAFPARALFSGPAGGVLASAQCTRAMRWPRAVAFDMGGTSADVCLIEADGAVHERGAIAGLPLPLPQVPVHTVGCGGGSIAFVDGGGALRVGPMSAGADPGPACYGKGSEPTVTDAHVALGHLGASTLLAGAFPIDVDASVRAIERLARRLGQPAAATARGILTIADATMARAILVITAERAVDPAQVPLVAYGGAGGLHAAGLLQRLGMQKALLPHLPGAFSALGLALAGESVECSAAAMLRLDTRSMRQLRAMGRELSGQARSCLEGGRQPARVQLTALVRHCGQGATLQIPFAANLANRFLAEHQRLFGFTTEAPIEVVRLVARAAATPRRAPAPQLPRPRAQPQKWRRVPIGRQRLAVHQRATLTAVVQGPAVIEEATACTLVPAGFFAKPTARGMVLRRAGDV